MKAQQISGIDKRLSRIVLGTMVINATESERSYELLDAAHESGINTFDTAIVYAGGNSERGLGPWINERGIREEIVVISKGCHHNQDRERVTPFDLKSDFHDSLARLQFDYIDIYMFHRDDPQVPVGPLVEAMNELIDAGKIRAFGASNWTYQRIMAANKYAEQNGLVPFTSSSPNYGLAEQVNDPWGPGCVSLSGPQQADARDWYEQTQLAVFAYSSLARGLFSGRVTRENYRQAVDQTCRQAYCHEVNFQRLDRAADLAKQKGVSVAQIALAFVLNSPMNTYALVGAESRQECEANVAAAEIKLSPAELAWLDLQSETL